MSPSIHIPFKRACKIVLLVLLIFAASFMATDYYLRGHLYYAQRAANFIYRNTWQAVFPPSGPVSLYVRAVADQDYRQAHSDWKSRITDLLVGVDERFADEFDIHFSLLGVAAWDRPEQLKEYSDILLYAEKKIDRKSTQILVIMTGKDDASRRVDRWVDVGIAHYLGNSIVVGDDFQLLHEMGHLFGTIDYPPGDPRFDIETIYSYQYANRTDQIDPANHDRIMKNKYRRLW